jgi:lipoate-protein ligase A
VSQLALDLALLELAEQDGVASVRTYGWARPTVSFGRHEAVRETWDVAGMQDAGWEVVRRPTGGRALLHEEVVTYAVAMPLPARVPWTVAYGAVNARLWQLLRTLGVPATLVDASEAPATVPAGAACFTTPVAGELLVHGAKLVGSAVWRTRSAFLQHGSILVRDRQAALDAFRRAPQADTPAHANAALADWLRAPNGGPGTERHAAAHVAAAIAAEWVGDGRTPRVLTATQQAALAQAQHGHATKLSDPAWLWRR